MIEAVHDGVELSSEFLDDLWLAIVHKVPAGKWVPITKDHDMVIAGLKLFMDCSFYGETEWDIVFNSEFTHFKKSEYPKKKKHPFEDQYITNHPASYWTAQDQLKLEREKQVYLRAQRAAKLEEQRDKVRPKRRKR